MLLATLGQANAIDTRRYFPLDHGSTWTTRTTTVRSMGDQPPPFTTVSTTSPGKIVNGKQTTKWSWTSDSDETDRTAPLFFEDASGTQILAMDQMEPDPLEAACLPVPVQPYVVLPNHVKVGQTFSGEMNSACHGSKVRWSTVTTVVGFDTITVPAGTFRTLVLRRDLTTTGTYEGKTIPPSRETATLYLAPGIGNVKEVTESSGVATGYARSTDTEVLISTSRKYDASAKDDR